MFLKTTGAALTLAMTLSAGAAFAQSSTYVEGICLEGGRSAAICTCADEKLFALLGEEKYGDYEALIMERLANPSAQWDGAIAALAAKRGVSDSEIKANVFPAAEMHRQFMRECR